MKIYIKNFTPVPSVLVIGCVKSIGLERIEIQFDKSWDKLKKEVTFYISDDNQTTITIPYKNSPITIPERVLETCGIHSYVVNGTKGNKKLVSRTGFLSVLPSPESFSDTIERYCNEKAVTKK